MSGCSPSAAAALSLIVACSGCTTLNIQKIPPQEGVYPAETAPDAPLVLAVPGLVVPGLRITQEQHFGYLVQMLAAEGIPCRILTYNTPEDPLSRMAALYSPEISIAWTRVGPAVVREFEAESERRVAHGLPPVKEIILLGYSQGGVIVAQFARRVFYAFRKEYKTVVKMFGDEWTALQKDPEFQYWINALDDYIAIRNIRVQYEKMFERSPSLRRYYERAEKKLDRQFEDFMQYLIDPSSKYPGVKNFEGIDSPYYPKRYEKIREYAAGRETRSEAERERNKQFFVTYAQYRSLLDVKCRILTAAASLFGSPQANDTMNIARWLPFVKRILGREYYQIRQTELGTAQQLERIETLAREYRDRDYPITPSDILFIVGANGDKGDGFVDQPSAHVSRHSYTLLKPKSSNGRRAELTQVAHGLLPELYVVPLEVMHFPEKVMGGLGGMRFGAAYMVPGNPVYPYLINFVKGDWEAIKEDLARDGNTLRQFMLEVSFAGERAGRLSARRRGQSDNVRITGRYFNSDTGTHVWTGYFREDSMLEELKERVHCLDLTELVPGLEKVFDREGDPESLGILQDLKEQSRLINPVPFLPDAGDLRRAAGAVGLAREESRLMPQDIVGEVRVELTLPDGRRAPLSCRVHPGTISFVMVETGKNAGSNLRHGLNDESELRSSP